MNNFASEFLGTCGFIFAVSLVIFVVYEWKEFQHDKEDYEKERADEMAKRALYIVNSESNAELLKSINDEFSSQSKKGSSGSV